MNEFDFNNEIVTVRQLKKGDFFTKKSIMCPKDSQVWIRGDFDRYSKKFECTRFDDINKTCFLSGDSNVFVDFCF